MLLGGKLFKYTSVNYAPFQKKKGGKKKDGYYLLMWIFWDLDS